MGSYFHYRPDNRGAHVKYFVASPDDCVSEIYCTVNHKGVIRGFHRSQAQRKIVKLLSGSARIIVIDATSKVVRLFKNATIETSPIHVQKGEWLAYHSLEDGTVINYIADEMFDPQKEDACHPSSFSELGDLWETDLSKAVISERDEKAPVVNIE